MVRVRWRKVFLDLLSNRARTILVISAIAVGVFAVGFVASAQSILLRELRNGYAASVRSSATLYTDPFTDELLTSVARVPGVGAVEGRRSLPVQVSVKGDVTRDLVLTAVADFSDMSLDKVLYPVGRWPAGEGELLVEQLSLPYLDAQIGDEIVIDLDDGRQKTLRIVGTAHDPNAPSPFASSRAFGYITPDTLVAFGLGDYFTELRYRVANDANNLTHIDEVTTAVQDKLEKSGRQVYAIDTPPPGEHFAQDIVETLVLLFTVFGFVILGLSGFLVVNTISALIAQQVQQIGVMKLVGARMPQIVIMYIVMVLAYGALALAIGIPMGILVGRWAVDFAAELMNVRIVDTSVPFSVIAMQAFVGLLIPLLAGLWPTFQGVQVTTFQALNDHGIKLAGASSGLADRLFLGLQKLVPVPRPLIISVRNTVRKKGRLLLTLVTLTLGTALFISVLSVRDSVQQTIDNFMRYHQYDVSVTLSQPVRQEKLAEVASQISGVLANEAWLESTTRRVYTDDTLGESAHLTAVPADTVYMNPTLEAGRWLMPGDERAVVVNTNFMDAEPDVKLGDIVTLDVNGRQAEWQIVGVLPGSGPITGAAVFVNYEPYTHWVRSVSQVNELLLKTADHTAEAQQQLATTAFTVLEDGGISVERTQTTEAIRERDEFIFNIIIGFLVLMAILLAAVGGLGLTTTMSINIMERIREIGVLRAIGASDRAVRQIVVVEGIFIGLLSWVVGSLLALPLSHVLSDQVGLALMGFPLDYSFATMGMLLWLIIVLVLAAVASLGPARNASKLTIREVLAYE